MKTKIFKGKPYRVLRGYPDVPENVVLHPISWKEWLGNIAMRVTNDIVGMWNTKHTFNTGRFFLIVFLFSVEGYYIRYLDPIDLIHSLQKWGCAFCLWLGFYLFVKLNKVTPTSKTSQKSRAKQHQ